jgi:predicted RNA binding protein YcfA (HicA-like mRNA interferase family)
MKRIKLIKHLETNGCYLLREGSNHSIFYNPHNTKISTVPRHNDIKYFITVKICRDLEIDLPAGK